MHELTFAASRLGHELRSHELRLMAHEGRERKQVPALVNDMYACFLTGRASWRLLQARPLRLPYRLARHAPFYGVNIA